MSVVAAPAADARGIPHVYGTVVAVHRLGGHHRMSGRAYRASLPGIPLPPRFQVVDGPCPFPGSDGGGCAFQVDTPLPDGRTIVEGTVFVVGMEDPHDEAFARLHELGHVYDAEVLTAADRAALIPLLNRHATSWADCGDYATNWGDNGCPLERFADAYATCRLREDPDGFTPWDIDSYGYDPTRRIHALVCGLIAAAGRRAGL